MRKVFSIALITLFVLLNVNLARTSFESSRKLSQINQEVDKVKDLEKENEELKLELKKRESSFFIEQQARDKLGYGRSGEVAIVVESENFANASEEKTAKSESNFQKWVNLLKFKN